MTVTYIVNTAPLILHRFVIAPAIFFTSEDEPFSLISILSPDRHPAFQRTLRPRPHLYNRLESLRLCMNAYHVSMHHPGSSLARPTPRPLNTGLTYSIRRHHASWSRSQAHHTSKTLRCLFVATSRNVGSCLPLSRQISETPHTNQPALLAGRFGRSHGQLEHAYVRLLCALPPQLIFSPMRLG